MGSLAKCLLSTRAALDADEKQAISDKKAEFVNSGYSEHEAEIAAVESMLADALEFRASVVSQIESALGVAKKKKGGDTTKPLAGVGKTTKPETIADQLSAKPEESAAAPQEKINDLGEKIGGARKDTATSTGPRRSRIADDEDAGWRKRYVAMQIMEGRKDAGKWMLADKRRAGRFGGVHMVSRDIYDTEAEALAKIPIVEVARNHRVASQKDSEGNSKYYIARDVSDRKRVRVVAQDFDSREAALEYMAGHAVEIIETKTSFGEEILPRPETVYRSGAKRRAGNVNGDDFMGQ